MVGSGMVRRSVTLSRAAKAVPITDIPDASWICRLCPRAAAGVGGSGFKVAQQATDHIPTVVTTYFDVALLVDSHQAGIGEACLLEFVGRNFVWLEHAHEHSTVHLNKFHVAPPVCSIG